MKSRNGFKIEFTDILYGTVIAISFEQILKPEVTTKLFMFFFALLIILDDWILYHVALSRITRTIKNYLLCFILDVVVLVSWYFIAIVSEEQFLLFLVFTTIFFGFTSIWGIIFGTRTMKKIMIETDIRLVIYFASVSICFMTFLQNYRVFTLTLCFLGFVLLRIRNWKNLLKEKEVLI
ncbi:MAG: hypothetical protein J7K81_03590 [Methanophagales archaeon]|nr:hypothetical protein [Methanophagales archaeon]